MEKNLCLLLCFTGIVPLALSTPHEYYLIQQKKTWSEAQAYCRSTYGDLATIETAEDMTRLKAEAQKYQFSSTAWIGLWNDVKSWRWSFGNKPLGSWTDWGAGEPGNSGGHEECGATHQDFWVDTSCTNKFPFMCFTEDSSSSKSFTYYSNPSTWSEAQAICRRDRTDLANPQDPTENSLIKQKLASLAGSNGTSNTMVTWIGLFRDSWKWTNWTVFSSITWEPGQPDNAAKYENCAYILNGQAGDALCSEIKPFFCYNVTMRQQILRVKVQSGQDVNDPAVKAAIMEQIKRKLRDHGMENAKVKWREQPDGVVFHKTKEENTTAALNTTR